MWFLCFALYLALIPLTAVGIVKYRTDPVDDDLWKKHNWNTLIGLSFVWPILWCMLLVAFAGKSLIIRFRALLSAYDREEE